MLLKQSARLSRQTLARSDAMSLQGYRNGPATQGSALYEPPSWWPPRTISCFTQSLTFTQDGTVSCSDCPQFTGLDQVRACSGDFDALVQSVAEALSVSPCLTVTVSRLTKKPGKHSQDGSGADWGDGLSQATAVVCACPMGVPQRILKGQPRAALARQLHCRALRL